MRNVDGIPQYFVWHLLCKEMSQMACTYLHTYLPTYLQSLETLLPFGWEVSFFQSVILDADIVFLPFCYLLGEKFLFFNQ